MQKERNEMREQFDRDGFHVFEGILRDSPRPGACEAVTWRNLEGERLLFPSAARPAL